MRKSLLVLALATIVFTMSTTAMADTYTFIYQNGFVSPGSANYGSVTVSSLGANNTNCGGVTSAFTNCTEVNVSLNSPYLLHGANKALGFTANTTFTFFSGTPAATLAGSGNMDGWGDYDSRINLSGGNSASLIFYLGSGSTLGFDTVTGGNGTTYFAAFVTPNTSCTGYIATGGPAGNNSTTSGSDTSSGACSPTGTPEPASLALLSAGLIGLGGLVRRRKQ